MKSFNLSEKTILIRCIITGSVFSFISFLCAFIFEDDFFLFMIIKFAIIFFLFPTLLFYRKYLIKAFSLISVFLNWFFISLLKCLSYLSTNSNSQLNPFLDPKDVDWSSFSFPENPQSEKRHPMAREATINNLISLGIPEFIYNKENLTVFEANAAISYFRSIEKAHYDKTVDLCRGKIPYGIRVLNAEHGSTEIVGESFHHRVLKNLYLRHYNSYVDKSFVWASIIREPKNKHDKDAVMIVIDGYHVGYLDSCTASEYNSIIKKISKGVPIVCRAVIIGKKYYGVWLDFDLEELKQC